MRSHPTTSTAAEQFGALVTGPSVGEDGEEGEPYAVRDDGSPARFELRRRERCDRAERPPLTVWHRSPTAIVNRRARRLRTALSGLLLAALSRGNPSHEPRDEFVVAEVGHENTFTCGVSGTRAHGCPTPSAGDGQLRRPALVTAQITGRNNYADVKMGTELEKQCRLMERRARSEDRRTRQRQGSL